MSTKRCSACNKTFSINMFNKHPTGKFGVKGFCRRCQSDKQKKYRSRLSERGNISSPKFKTCYVCRENLSFDLFYSRKSNKDGLEDRCKRCSCDRYDSEKYREYYNKNREKKIKSVTDRINNNINARIASRMRSRLSVAIRGMQKSGSAIRDLGCTIVELKKYLEQMFNHGMTWENYGDWHIDHIRPLSSFDLTDRDQFLEACNYTNLQPLWAKDNLKKGARYDE